MIVSVHALSQGWACGGRPARLIVSLVTLPLLIGSALICSVLVAQSADGSESIAPQGVLVVGDSITASYDALPGSPTEGWWSIVGRHYGVDVHPAAEAGSGYQRPGARCTGTTFEDRPGLWELPPPSLVIVEGGRNDWARCVDGELVPTSAVRLADAVDAFLTRLAATWPDATVVVLAPPWGPLQAELTDRVARTIGAVAGRRGLTYVSMDGVLPAAHVVDGVHPNRTGSTAIAERVIAALG